MMTPRCPVCLGDMYWNGEIWVCNDDICYGTREADE